MIMQDLRGKQYYQELSNSDLVYYNDYYEMLRIKEYTFQKKQLFMKKKQIMVILPMSQGYSNNKQEMQRVSVACALRSLLKSLDSLPKSTTAISVWTTFVPTVSQLRKF